jgi:hypothetical protein
VLLQIKGQQCHSCMVQADVCNHAGASKADAMMCSTHQALPDTWASWCCV